MRIAAIDVGTNSVKLSVAAVQEDGSLSVIQRRRINLQIGRSVMQCGRLGPDLIEVVATTVASLCQLADSLGAIRTDIVGTSAPREAEDSEALQKAVRDASGHPLRIITGLEEATLTWEAVCASHHITGPAIMIDVGGGSTEVVCANGPEATCVASMPLGAVRLTQQFDTTGLVTPARMQEMTQQIHATMASSLSHVISSPDHIYATGGTITALSLLANLGMPLPQNEALDAQVVDGQCLQATFVRSMVDRLAGWDLDQRVAKTGLSTLRSEVILAGATIVLCLLEVVNASSCQVHELGIREGLMRRMARGGDQTP